MDGSTTTPLLLGIMSYHLMGMQNNLGQEVEVFFVAHVDLENLPNFPFFPDSSCGKVPD